MGEPMAASPDSGGFLPSRCAPIATANRSSDLVAAGAVDAGDPGGRGARERRGGSRWSPMRRQVEEALFAARTVGSKARARPALFIDMSTISPVSTTAFDARLRAAGHRFIDAPVSGGPARAASGTLALMVGASDADLCRTPNRYCARWGRPTHVGPVGHGRDREAGQPNHHRQHDAGQRRGAWSSRKRPAQTSSLVRDVILTATGANYLLDKWLPGNVACRARSTAASRSICCVRISKPRWMRRANSACRCRPRRSPISSTRRPPETDTVATIIRRSPNFYQQSSRSRRRGKSVAIRCSLAPSTSEPTRST